jgi:hypothetical protein
MKELPNVRLMQRHELEAELSRLRVLVHNPQNDDWRVGVITEAAHQCVRWGTSHDAGKEPQDWFWLLGYLGGKCLRACIDGDLEKAKHHTISTSAALLNWHRQLSGLSNGVRPGTEEPQA